MQLKAPYVLDQGTRRGSVRCGYSLAGSSALTCGSSCHAKVLGLTVPDKLFALADEVIE
jgi:hypothetical protein